MNEMPISVVLCDPQPLFLNGVRERLKTANAIEVIGETTTGTGVIELAQTARPDVVLTDSNLPDTDGRQLLRELRRHPSKILVLTDEESPGAVLDAMLAGANGYLVKRSPDDLIVTLRRVAQGERVMCSRSLNALIDAVGLLVQGRDTLTEREREILRRIAAGARQEAVAAQLGISPHTVKNHLAKIYRKLGVKTSAAAVGEAHRRNLI